ncbi:MAG TPA: sn-glycerol-3-phosphate ABC transporter ATP-binding protein UgpC [Burkholderiales bacterium]|nr:sn-glycerol-3-phosphate ABC transporter ATP-binding protein UgpC [Burkholderiales bacterium]
MARIRFDSVGKTYPNGFVALENLSLEIADREFVVLLGPSGCGKSTTLNLIAGLEDVTAGSLYFDETLMNVMPAHKRDVAMVFQSYALYPHKSVYENIAFGLRMRGFETKEIERRVREAARTLEIEPLLERRPHQLSGGQRQRVALGRALVRQPQAFLMDEPLSNLDAALRIAMRAEIKKLHQTMRTTFVYVTHDQAEALTLADRIVVMRDGVIQQIGTPEEIYDRPRNTFVASFLGNPPINYLDGALSHDGRRFMRGALSLPVPVPMPAQAGRPVKLGIRAEDVDLRGTGEQLSGRISSVLPVGSDQFLGVELDGATLFFRVGREVRAREGESISLPVNAGRLQVFDAVSGASLLWQ